MTHHLKSSPDARAASPLSSLVGGKGHSRRSFFGRLGALAAGTVAATGLTGTALGAGYTRVDPTPLGPLSRRRERAYKMRMLAANALRKKDLAPTADNGDELRYPTRIGSFTKCLPHNDQGLVDPDAYEAMLKALASGRTEDFFAIPMGGDLLFHSPQAAYALAFHADDIWQFSMPPAPELASAEKASEMAEVYWMALARDIPFAEYDTHPLIAEAAADLSAFSDFRGPKEGGQVTPRTLFRTRFGGVQTGPFISQFLIRPFTSGIHFNPQVDRFPAAGSDYVKTYDSWLALKRGTVLEKTLPFDPQPRRIRCLRDMSEWVHNDFPALSASHAAFVLMGLGPDFVFENNPYNGMGSDMGFATFGPADLFATLNEAANMAVRAAWYQKWLIHRHLRPEEYAGLVHQTLANGMDTPLHPEIFASKALARIHDAQGTWLVPLAYPEGCPPHSAYPSGHAAFVGATITVLKAYFRDDAVLPDPMVPSSDGSELEPWTGPPLTVGGELNKLAMNVAMGRMAAGIHWRSDAVEGMLLGEQVALSLLRDLRMCYKEYFTGFKFTRLDGTQVTI